ncbi:MAG: glutathione S-transferase N-terminal domain-containing protein [Candidatus Accumulibacter sp.]|jgi:glutathione S-transferase|nr:glutathione S-transferase N-terminal domain-containing protein [Accumulibacter sp.]
MKVIGSQTSPFVRKVCVVLAEKKIDYDFELQSPWDTDTTVPNFNPLGKVPVLVLDDLSTLFDSRVIVEYLDSIAPNNKLMPESNRERAEVKCWCSLADGISEAAANIFLEKKRPPAQQSEEWIVRQKGKIASALRFMAAQLNENERSWCIGTHYSLADVTTGCALGYLLFRFPEIAWREEYPVLACLYDKLIKRESFSTTVPPANA